MVYLQKCLSLGVLMIFFCLSTPARAFCTTAILPQTCYQFANGQWEINKTICNETTYHGAAPECKVKVSYSEAFANCEFSAEALESTAWGYYMPTGCDWVIGGCTYEFYHHQDWGSAAAYNGQGVDPLQAACCNNSPSAWPCGEHRGMNVCESLGFTPSLGNCP